MFWHRQVEEEEETNSIKMIIYSAIQPTAKTHLGTRLSELKNHQDLKP